MLHRLLEQVQTWLAPRSETDTIRLGRQAEQWLAGDPANVALARMRQDALNRWYTAATTEERERCWFEVHRIDVLVQQVQRLVKDAALASQRSDTREKQRRADRLAV